jgi:hypothetical protein
MGPMRPPEQEEEVETLTNAELEAVMRGAEDSIKDMPEDKKQESLGMGTIRAVAELMERRRIGRESPRCYEWVSEVNAAKQWSQELTEALKLLGVYFDGTYWRSVAHPVKGTLKCWATLDIAVKERVKEVRAKVKACEHCSYEPMTPE